MIKQAVILCAGEGSRLGAASGGEPKPMTWVGGKYFVEHLINDLTEAGVQDIILLVRYKADNFEKVAVKHSNVRLIKQGMAGTREVDKSVLNIRPLKNKFLVANGDCYPILKGSWEILLSEDQGGVGVCKEIDTGFAIIEKDYIASGFLSCTRFSEMMKYLPHIQCFEVFHIGTQSGLREARENIYAPV